MAKKSTNANGKKKAGGALRHIKQTFSNKKTSATARCLPPKKLTCTEVTDYVKANNKCKSVFSDELIICEIYKETTFNAHAYARSNTGPHVGLMQMYQGAIDDVNKANGTTFTLDDMNDPEKAIQAGTLYLCYLKSHYDLPNAESTLNAFRYGPKSKGKPPKHDKEHYAERILRCETCLQKNPKKCVDCTSAINPPKPKAKQKHAKPNATQKSAGKKPAKRSKNA